MRKLNIATFFSVITMCIFLLVFSSYIIKDITSEKKSLSPFGIDFGVYYTAGQMVISSNTSDIYNLSEHHVALEKVLNRQIPFFLGWVYPPTFLLLIIPFSFLPYHFALVLWLIVTFALAIYAAYLLALKHKKVTLLLCGFPGVLMNLRWGQNGFLNTALLGFGLYFVETKPIMSGLMFGLLTYKPQIACFPLLLLLITRKWKVLFWSILFSVILALVSGIMFGFDIWVKFYDSFFNTSAELLTSVWQTTASIQPTLYSTLRLFGVNGQIVLIFLIIVYITTTIATVWVWKKTDRLALRGSALVIGIMLTMPYFLEYDLMILSIPFILLSYDYLEHGYRPYEIVILGALWLMPLINLPIVRYTRVQICPFILIAVFVMLLRRVHNEGKIYNGDGSY